MSHITIESEKDEWGDKLYFVSEHNRFWIDNFSDSQLKKEQMVDFLKKCLDYMEANE